MLVPETLSEAQMIGFKKLPNIKKVSRNSQDIEVLPWTKELIKKIAQRNGNMTMEEVETALLKGLVVYTNFSRYSMNTQNTGYI
jgi:hypothetical protein